MLFPSPLKKRDKIAVVSPAGYVQEQEIMPVINLIHDKGYEVIFSPNCFGKFQDAYTYSGTEESRISDFNWALNHKEVFAIWATRGGYGCLHLLKNLKLSIFRKKPKWYIGYSDNTAIQSFLLENGFASIHGQTLKTSNFGVSEKSFENIFDILEGKKENFVLNPHYLNKYGKSKGILVGGNLTLIYALLGTAYGYEFKDKILFIEDIGESFYNLDRMLISLDLAGVFKKIKGIIIGGMTQMGDKCNPNYNKSFDDFAYKIIHQRLSKYSFPCIFAFPNGHIFDNRPLVLGSAMEMNVSEKQVQLNFL